MQPDSSLRKSSVSLLLLLATVLLVAGACDDPFGPRIRPVPEEPGTATLHDFRGDALRSPSAFDIITPRAVRTDQTSGWDFLFAISAEGEPQFRPRGLIVEGDSEAGLQRVDRSFEQVEMAPEEGYVTDAPTAVESGAVYVAVSRQDPGFRRSRCRRFMKLEVQSLDLQDGTVEFRFLGNPNCEDRILIPGAEGSE